MAFFVIKGDIHAGKTTYAKNIADMLMENGYKIGGFLSIGKFENDRRSEFNILSLDDRQRQKLAIRGNIESDENTFFFGSYTFFEAGFSFAEKVYKRSVKNTYDFIFIDEVGIMELNKQGFYKLIENVDNNINLIIVSRAKFLDKVNSTFFNNSLIILDINNSLIDNYNLLVSNKNKGSIL